MTDCLGRGPAPGEPWTLEWPEPGAELPPGVKQIVGVSDSIIRSVGAVGTATVGSLEAVGTATGAVGTATLELITKPLADVDGLLNAEMDEESCRKTVMAYPSDQRIACVNMLPTGEWAKMSWKHRLETLVAFNAAGKLPDAQEKALATEMVAAPSVASEDDLARKEAAAERQKERDELRKKSRVVIN